MRCISTTSSLLPYLFSLWTFDALQKEQLYSIILISFILLTYREVLKPYKPINKKTAKQWVLHPDKTIFLFVYSINILLSKYINQVERKSRESQGKSEKLSGNAKMLIYSSHLIFPSNLAFSFRWMLLGAIQLFCKIASLNKMYCFLMEAQSTWKYIP